MAILIGADPEFFVRSKKTGELVSAVGLIEGTKAKPVPMGPGMAQVDGMALEINVPPAENAKDFIAGFHATMAALRKELPDFTFDFSPVAHFGREMIDAQPPEAQALGCEPDYNAYTGKVNVPPNANAPFRTASGHIHIGWTENQEISDPDHMEACCMLSKQMDYYLGLPSLMWDHDVTRRELYGKAGCFRPKSYGMEYRTLSNVWLTTDEMMWFVVEQSIRSFEDLVAQRNYGTLNNVRSTIDQGKWKKAHDIYRVSHRLPAFALAGYKALLKAEQPEVVEAPAGVADNPLVMQAWQRLAMDRANLDWLINVPAPAGIRRGAELQLNIQGGAPLPPVAPGIIQIIDEIEAFPDDDVLDELDFGPDEVVDDEDENDF